jgi:hypothetical protein
MRGPASPAVGEKIDRIFHCGLPLAGRSLKRTLFATNRCGLYSAACAVSDDRERNRGAAMLERYGIRALNRGALRA